MCALSTTAWGRKMLLQMPNLAVCRLSLKRSSQAATCQIPCYFFSSNATGNEKATSLDGGGTSSPATGICKKIAFIGSGKMAEAMISPLVKTKLQPAQLISVFDVSRSTLNRMVDKYKVEPTTTIAECIHEADLIICAVKPQNSDLVNSEIKKAGTGKDVVICPDATLLSIVAGKSIASFEASGISRIARSMPNTPATIGSGITVWTCTPNVCQTFRNRIEEILCCFGKSIYVDDEKFVDMSTSISGSGPAYIFMLMEAMIDAGVHMGFSREMATTLTYHTLLGSTLYAMETGEHPAILKNSVTSPAGTTASALYELESGKFRTVIKDAIWACYRRTLEMGGSDSNVGPGRTYVGALPSGYRPPSGEMYDNTNNAKRGKK